MENPKYIKGVNVNLNMKKVLFFNLSLLLCILTCVFIFVGCGSEQVYIVSIEKTLSEGLVDYYTIVYSDDTMDVFTVTNGEKGSQGEQGIRGVAGKDGHTPKVIIGANGNWYVDGVDSGIQATGPRGIGISSIEKTSTQGLVDTFTITYDDGSTTTFTVTNGKEGIQGIQGIPGKDGHTPQIKIGANGNWCIDDVDSGVRAQGLSAYELYLKNNPNYTKSEAEWLNDLANGKLSIIYITFDANGGTSVPTQTVAFGSYLEAMEEPTYDGYDFVGWQLNGALIDIRTFVFFADSKLVAVWKDADTLDVTFNTNGGVVVSGVKNIKYGENYELPTPSKTYQTFDGWYYEDTLIPISGIWNYTRKNITLNAKWKAPNIYAYLTVDSSYGACDSSMETIRVGDKFKLPVPTSIKNGYTFTGWYLDTEKITDKDGLSLNICKWESSVTLRASYYIEIATIYDFMSLAGKDLTGNYLVTNDLDFNGLGINSINSLNGTFDFGGHKLSNFILLSGASNKEFSGIFKTLNSGTVKNLVIENADCKNQYSSGVVGVSQASTISNITITNSFNNKMRSLIVGQVYGKHYYDDRCYINNVTIINSGINVQSFIIYNRMGYVKESTYDKDYHLPNIYLDNVNIVCKLNTEVTAGVIYSSRNYENSASGKNKSYYWGDIYINYFNLDANVLYGITGTSLLVQLNSKIIVTKSVIKGNTDVVWGYVDSVTDCINYGKSSEWGAKNSIRVIDCGNEYGRYKDYPEFNSSINLFPDANGIYSYNGDSGELGTIEDVSLITKEYLVSMFGFDETIWDLDNFDLINNVYPAIRSKNANE